jgi:cupin 2 domain-containing protein
MKTGNLFADLPRALAQEEITELLAAPNVTIERIVSHGQSSPSGFWYDQARPEWVILVAGAAGLRFEGEAKIRTLRSGDYLHIPAHVRHRIEWTDEKAPTIWVAVHYC